MIRKLRFVLLALFLAPLAVYAGDSYPRLGGYLISSPHEYWDSDYQKRIAQLDVAILNVFPGWGKSHDTNMVEVTKQIKARNGKTRLFLYVIPESMLKPAPKPWAEVEAKILQNRWWLYSGGEDLVLSSFGHETYVLNITPFAPRDSDGLRFNEWFAQYVAQQFGAPNPNIDGIYTDNVFWRPRRDGDWNRDGRIDSKKDPAVGRWYRQGYRQYFDMLKKRMPGKLQLGNVADWGDPGAVLTEYEGMLNGGVLEGVLGKNYSVEKRDGWEAMMKYYRKAMAALAPPKLLLFNQGGDPKDYQAMRYGLTSCLMDDGYYDFNDNDEGYHGFPWFDEYNANLGQAVSPPAMKAWQQGVYRRDFENGIALVNPKGNGPQQVTLETTFYKLKGTQDPAVNDGKAVTKVTLKDRDGIILMRKEPIRRPAPPKAVTIEAANH